MNNLLPNEKIEKFESELSLPWEAGNLRVVTEHFRWSIKTVVQTFEQFDLAPEYQRRRRWKVERRSRLIESLMLNVPIPPIFLLEVGGTYEVMDGLQRLTTIIEFYQGKFSLTKLPIIREIDNLTYSELPGRFQRAFERSTISAVTLLEESTKNKAQKDWMKLIVFERINSGGIQLEPQEIRHALHPGPMNSLTTTLSKNNVFTRCWGYNVEDGKITTLHGKDEKAKQDYTCMRDVERVLRFFALRQRDRNPKVPLKKHLDEYLANANSFPKETLDELEKIFLDTMTLAFDLFGPHTFARWGKGKWYKSRSELVYEAVSQALSLRLEDKASLLTNKDAILASIKPILSAESDNWKSNYAGWRYGQQRIKQVLEVLDGQIAAK